MGAPSLLHETRVADLETLATLALFTAPVYLPWRLRPDVARVSPAGRALFLGDAKATETAGCAATFTRLRWYATGLPSVEPELEYALVALAVDDGPTVREWEHALALAFGAYTVTGARTSIASLDETAVVSLSFPVR